MSICGNQVDGGTKRLVLVNICLVEGSSAGTLKYKCLFHWENKTAG